MRYCSKCHYDLEGLKKNTECPECGAYDRIDKLPHERHGYYSSVAVCLYIFLASTPICLYGAGPFNIAGTISLYRLPDPIVNTSYFLSIATLAYVLARTVFAFDLSKIPKWNLFIMYPLIAVLSILVASVLLTLLWVVVTIIVVSLS
jgi:hypothetical protein